jgi:hypothetical protein
MFFHPHTHSSLGRVLGCCLTAQLTSLATFLRRSFSLAHSPDRDRQHKTSTERAPTTNSRRLSPSQCREQHNTSSRGYLGTARGNKQRQSQFPSSRANEQIFARVRASASDSFEIRQTHCCAARVCLLDRRVWACLWARLKFNEWRREKKIVFFVCVADSREDEMRLEWVSFFGMVV